MNTYKPKYKNKIFAVTSAAVVIFLISFFIIPDYIKMKTLNTEIKKLAQMQNTQIKLRPLYDKIRARAVSEKSFDASVPSKGWFNRAKIINISQIFNDLAEKNGLECLKTNPDVDTLSDDSDVMLTSLELKGKFERFRNFLLDVTSLDYLDSLEEIQFVSGQSGKKYMLKIWISIK